MAQQKQAKQRKMATQYDKINAYIQEDIRENKLSAAAIAQRNAEEEAEKKQW